MLCGQGQHYRLKTTHRVEQAAEAGGPPALVSFSPTVKAAVKSLLLQ